MNLKDAAAVVSAYVDANVPCFKWGPPGVGKSDLARLLASTRGWNMIDFRCSTRDPVALMGLPDVSGETTRWRVPDEFPQVARDGERGILMLDELNAAAPSMQAAAFGLVLDRKVGEYTLPSGWIILAAGNRQTDRSAAQRMPAALANRFAHVDIDPDVDTFTAWANVNGISPIVIAFVRFRQELLHRMEGSELRAFPTPRAWAQVSKVVSEKKNADIRLPLVTGLVGEGAGAEFEGFVRTFMGLPSLDVVLANPDTAAVPKDPAAKYAMASGLAHKATKENFGKIMIYAQRMEREFEIMLTVDAVRRDSGLAQTKAFTDWAVRNQDVTLN